MKKSHEIMFFSAGLLTLTSWVIAFYYWSRLPEVIPVHFGISGQPDDWANKSIWYVFLIPALQLLMLAMFVFLYYKPQYSDMPTTLWLMTLPEKHRQHAFELIRVMLVGISLWIGVLFTYLTYGMNYSALNVGTGLIPWVMLGILVLMIIWLTFWTVKVYRATKEAMSKVKK